MKRDIGNGLRAVAQLSDKVEAGMKKQREEMQLMQKKMDEMLAGLRTP